MEWDKMFDQSNKPTLDDINNFINNNLWQALNNFIRDTYNVKPKITYSKCSFQRGWNVKYQKSGKSLCTLYPMPGYFIALVVMGNKEMPEADLMQPLLCDYIQSLYKNTPFSCGGKWLVINITSDEILHDTEKLILLRVKAKNKVDIRR